MTADFRTVPLSSRKISQALPLIQTTWPHVDTRAWHAYCRHFLARAKQTKAGIVAICDSSEYLCGVFVYEVQPDLHQTQTLTVPLFVAADLHNSVALIGNLLEAARQKARDLACVDLQIWIHQERPASRSRLKMLGLVDRAGYLWESVGSMRPSS